MTKSERFKLAHSQAREARAAGQGYRAAFVAALKASFAADRNAVDPPSDLHRRYDGAVPAAELRRAADAAGGAVVQANRLAGRNSFFRDQSVQACRAVGRALKLYGPRSPWFDRAKANQADAWSSFNRNVA